MNIVDRRPNPKGKSLSNRQRFLARARAEVKSAVQNALRKRKVADVEHGEKVAIPMRGITEPVFHHSRRTGRNEHVVPGNKEYRARRRDPAAERRRGARRLARAARTASGEDAFEFTLSKDEFLDMFFEDLELPDLVKKSLQGDLCGRSAARRLHRHRHAVQSQRAADDAQQHGAAASRCAGRSSGKSRPARGGCEDARARGARGGGANADPRARPHRAPQQDHPLYRPARCSL